MEEKKELEPSLWTPRQVATYLGVTPLTVYRWLGQGRVIDPKKVVRFARAVRIPRSEVVRIAGTVQQRLMDKATKQASKLEKKVAKPKRVAEPAPVANIKK